MLITTNDLCRESIRETLVQHAGESPDAGAIAEAILTAWREWAAKLNPLIGARGVDVLFRRSLHLTRNQFPGIAINGGDKDALLADLKANLASRETTADALEAGLSLLLIFAELLETLIGEALAGRLLCTALAPQSADINMENLS